MAKLSDKEKMMLACMLAGNDGQSRVEIERPNPDEGVYLVVPDSWALNESVGVVNVVFTVAETMTQGENVTDCKGRRLVAEFWINNKSANARTARSLHLALFGSFMKEQPEIATVFDWFKQLADCKEWVIRRTVKEGKGRFFANDAFFSKARWAELDKDSKAETSPAVLNEALGTS